MTVSLRAWLDRSSVSFDVGGAGGPELHLVVELEAEGAPVEVALPPSTTVLAIDVSGSMQGPPLDHVMRSVDRLLDGLGPGDQVGVVSFASEAELVVAPVDVDAAGKRLVRSRVAQLFAEGSTDLEAGLELAVQALGLGGPDRRRGVVVLSDGVPNQGAVTADALRALVRRHRAFASFATLGYGAEHDEDLLAAIAEAGGGGYQFVPDPASCARAFAMAVGAQADVVADSIELTLAPAEGVEIARVLGGVTTRVGRGGMVVPVPDLTPGSRQLLAFALRLTRTPGADRFVQDIAALSLTSRTSRTGERATTSLALELEVSPHEPKIVAEAARRVMLVRSDDVRAEARALADRRNFAGASAHLRALLDEIARVPGFSLSDGSQLAEAYELVKDEVLAMERHPDAEAYDRFRKNAAGSRLSFDVPPASARGVASARLLERIAGDVPAAELVVVRGPNAGERHRLVDRCVIGRLRGADLRVPDPSLAGRHAEVHASEGAWFVRDYGTTNATKVGGTLVKSATKLAAGDVLVLGDVELRFELVPDAPIRTLR